MDKTVAAWVSVEERLPEETGCYAVYSPNPHGYPAVWGTWFYTGTFGGFDVPERWEPVEITHWAPLPEPPQK